MQEARAAGCYTSAQAERYIAQKRKNEAEESTRKLRRVNHLNGEPDNSLQGNALESSVLDSTGKDTTTAGQAISSSLDCWDITGFPGADLLSETVRTLLQILLLTMYHNRCLFVLKFEHMIQNPTSMS